MHLSLVQQQAITACMALIVGAKEFDRLFPGVQFSKLDGDSVCALNEELAAEMEDRYAVHISIVATDILKTEIGVVMVLPRVVQQRQHQRAAELKPTGEFFAGETPSLVASLGRKLGSIKGHQGAAP